MANNDKQVASSPSSDYLNEIFGTKQHPDSPASVLAIFSPKSKDSRKNTTSSVLTGNMPMYQSGSQAWNPKQENIPKDSEANKEKKSTFQQRSEHPCPLSSSIYYGSQEDMYIKSSSAQASKSYPTFNKDENEDNFKGMSTEDEGAATIKWWEGSLYY
ncbi:hypothetical protein POM88_013293 [Heracleum sosnowskyi]|uniref:Uncharacterized protein n=1 Tax=Heracleum sosnowskyi TaxID=360622 RepID=A0AAD8IY30_9APIA|nr:hypothetical protein POM88_013293 [Heracleum sosnowskyi]